MKNEMRMLRWMCGVTKNEMRMLRRMCGVTKNEMRMQRRMCGVTKNEMRMLRMLRWMCGVTKNDKIGNEHVRGSVKVAPVTKKMAEKGLKWYGHVRTREEGCVLRRMLDAPVPGRRCLRKTENQVERLVS